MNKILTWAAVPSISTFSILYSRVLNRGLFGSNFFGHWTSEVTFRLLSFLTPYNIASFMHIVLIRPKSLFCKPII